jgi:hypothetical protein
MAAGTKISEVKSRSRTMPEEVEDLIRARRISPRKGRNIARRNWTGWVRWKCDGIQPNRS